MHRRQPPQPRVARDGPDANGQGDAVARGGGGGEGAGEGARGDRHAERTVRNTVGHDDTRSQ